MTYDERVGETLALVGHAGVSPVRTLANTAGHWPRWVLASVLTYFDARRRGLPMFAEGEDDDAKRDAKEWIEVRVDGPFVLQPSRGFYHVEVEVNVLVATLKDDVDLYRHYRNVGTVGQAFLGPIPVLKLGGGVDDDGSVLGCLAAVRSFDQREALRTTHFGQLDASTPVMRSSVEGHYYMQLHA